MHKIIQYRDKCIGCGVCYEQQPEIWRMSRRDGKAILLHAIQKKETFILNIQPATVAKTKNIANACPVKIIKVL
jgi:ferredoxin